MFKTGAYAWVRFPEGEVLEVPPEPDPGGPAANEHTIRGDANCCCERPYHPPCRFCPSDQDEYIVKISGSFGDSCDCTNLIGTFVLTRDVGGGSMGVGSGLCCLWGYESETCGEVEPGVPRTLALRLAFCDDVIILAWDAGRALPEAQWAWAGPTFDSTQPPMECTTEFLDGRLTRDNFPSDSGCDYSGLTIEFLAA